MRFLDILVLQSPKVTAWSLLSFIEARDVREITMPGGVAECGKQQPSLTLGSVCAHERRNDNVSL
jgi:hypothetical protein